ncbi:hypothetical protein D3C81_785330 [compost metagenome]
MIRAGRRSVGIRHHVNVALYPVHIVVMTFQERVGTVWQAHAKLIILHPFAVLECRLGDRPVDLGSIKQHQPVGRFQAGLEHLPLNGRELHII